MPSPDSCREAMSHQGHATAAHQRLLLTRTPTVFHALLNVSALLLRGKAGIKVLLTDGGVCEIAAAALQVPFFRVSSMVQDWIACGTARLDLDAVLRGWLDANPTPREPLAPEGCAAGESGSGDGSDLRLRLATDG